MCLKSKAMLVNFTMSQWSARKYDPAVSREVEKEHNASNAGRFNKLLVDDQSLKQIGKMGGKARTFHYENTLPWGDNGDRLLPSANYFTYVAEMGRLKADFQLAVDVFLVKYSGLIEDARGRLGSMFNEFDYPSAHKAGEKFGFEFRFMPVADQDDFRVSIAQDEQEKIKADISSQIQTRIDDAIQDLSARIREAISRMYLTLNDPEAIFRDSLIENIRDLVHTVPKLNFNNDPVVNELVNRAASLLCDPEKLRTDKAFRAAMAEKAR